MKLSDLIANSILQLINDDGGMAEIQRNLFAEQIGCAPSQINYVITSRFTPEQGYLVESQRGGGGYIRITRMDLGDKAMLMHVINAVGEKIDYHSARVNVENLVCQNLLNQKQARLILCALSDKVLHDVPTELRDRVRACLYKNLLLSTM